MSNLAWDAHDDDTVGNVCLAHGIHAVEIAPTKVDPHPLNRPLAFWSEYRKRWESRGLQIVALQAILYGRPELQLFGDDKIRLALRLHLQGMARLAGTLGATRLVFGAPRNRRRGPLPPLQANDIAEDFFTQVGNDAAAEGVVLCLEPNATAYGCDFITTAAEGIALVRSVNSSGFGLHLDVGCMTMAHEDIASSIMEAGDFLHHFHASEPHLAPLGEGGADHSIAARSLHSIGYRGYVSAEMRPPEGRAAVVEAARVAALLRAHYLA